MKNRLKVPNTGFVLSLGVLEVFPTMVMERPPEGPELSVCIKSRL